MRATTYRSIFLNDDWAHQRYFGWNVSLQATGFRVLTRKMAIFDRHLILLEPEGVAAFEQYGRSLAGKAGLIEINVHDFGCALTQYSVIPGINFHPASERERMLNTATFVVDVSNTDDALLERMSSDYRRKIRRAISEGVVIEATATPTRNLIAGFANAFLAFALERGLNPIGREILERMYQDGRALLLVARKNCEVTNYLHLYRAGEAASFMYGVNLSKTNDGAGQYLHYEAMRALRERGIRWYDMGGVASTDPSDGIFRFKQNFGGELVDLGREWRHTGRIMAAGKAGFRRARAFARSLVAS